MRAFFASLLLAAAAAAQPASIEGTVVTDADGQPLSGVHVSLVSTDFVESPATFGAMSDRSGHFSIANVSPGTYMVRTARTGYAYARKSGSSAIPVIHLKAGQQLAGFKVRLTQRVVITGRVVDEFGDPVMGVMVTAGYKPDEPVMAPGLPEGPLGATDDRGTFRILMAPGKYYLKALPKDYGSTEAPEIRTDGSIDIAYGITYYPGVASAERATAVECTAGRDVTGIEIRLARMLNLNVSGVVTGPGGPAAASVWLRSAQWNREAGANANGRFTFNRVEPGTYRIYALASGKPPMQSQVVNMRVEDVDQNNVQLLLGSAGDLSGKVEVAGAPLTGRHAVRLKAVGQISGGTGGIAGGTLDADGAFDFTGIPPGRYRVDVDPMPEGGYVKSAFVDGIEAHGATLDLMQGVHAAKVKITLGRNGGTLSGTIRDATGDAVGAGWGLAVLATDDNPADPEIDPVRADGKYSFERLRPGKYKVAVVDLLNFSGNLDRDGLQAALAHGEAIEIEEGSHITKDLKLATAEAGDGKN